MEIYSVEIAVFVILNSASQLVSVQWDSAENFVKHVSINSLHIYTLQYGYHSENDNIIHDSFIEIVEIIEI